MTCEKCGGEASTQFVTFQQNIGLFFVRFPSQLQANLCMNCIHVQFWKMTLISMVAGWWGIISAFTNITFILNNISQYSAARQAGHKSSNRSRARNANCIPSCSPV